MRPLTEWIASSLGAFDALPLLAMIALVVTVIIFLTEITSNTATAAAFLPLLGALAVARGSPGNAGDSGRGRCQLRLHDAGRDTTQRHRIRHGTVADPAMIKAGFVLNLFGVLLVSLLCYGPVGWIWAS